jgi:hypothetical protein
MKLTKTEHAMLTEAARKPSGTLYAMTWYSTSSRQGTRGGRARDALKKLVEKGLADGYRAESNHGPNSDGWGSTHATEFTARITEKGREFLRMNSEFPCTK